MKSKKPCDAVEMEVYPDGKMGVILSKTVRDKFAEVFKDRKIDIFVGIGEKDRRMVIEVTVAKYDYIA